LREGLIEPGPIAFRAAHAVVDVDAVRGNAEPKARLALSREVLCRAMLWVWADISFSSATRSPLGVIRCSLITIGRSRPEASEP
jgi:hypothetical protein